MRGLGHVQGVCMSVTKSQVEVCVVWEITCVVREGGMSGGWVEIVGSTWDQQGRGGWGLAQGARG